MYHSELFHHVENFWKKRFLVDIKAKYFFLKPKCGAWRQNGGRLGDVTEAGRRFPGVGRWFCKSGGWEVILAGIMAPLHTLPRLVESMKVCFPSPRIKITTLVLSILWIMVELKILLFFILKFCVTDGQYCIVPECLRIQVSYWRPGQDGNI